jgi:hypothetical protein
VNVNGVASENQSHATANQSPQVVRTLIWEYCLASAECIFGGLSSLARDIHERLRLEFPGELDRTDLHQATGRNKPAHEITRALAELNGYGLATSRKEQTGGAPRELWRAATK